MYRWLREEICPICQKPINVWLEKVKEGYVEIEVHNGYGYLKPNTLIRECAELKKRQEETNANPHRVRR